MAKKAFFLLFFAVAAVANAAVYDRDSLLRELDRTVADAATYRAKYEEHIASARKEMNSAIGHEEQLRCIRTLSHYFFTYQNDSALYYNGLALRIAEAQNDFTLYVHLMCEKALLYGFGGLPYDGFTILDSLAQNPRATDPELRKTIYESYFDVNDFFYHYNLPGGLQTRYDQKLAAIRDSFYHYCPDRTEQAIHTIAAVASSKEIIEKLLKELESSQSDMERATLAMIIANRYQSGGDAEQQEIYLLLSAIYHIRAARLDNEALVKLGNMMIDAEDWDRAYAYVKLAHLQALLYGSRSRLLQLSPMLEELREHHAQQMQKWKTTTIVSWFVGLLLLAAFLAIWHTTRKRGIKLKQTLSKLEAAKADAEAKKAASLTLAETHSDALSLFMKIAIDITFDFVHLRRLVARKLKNKDTADLLKQLSSQDEASKIRTELLRKLDIAFVRLFPDFITQVNALMQPEAQISKPENELLSTELRLLALWRLGVTEAARVATILDLSVNTIYFYRNKLRNGAIDRERFGENIMAI